MCRTAVEAEGFTRFLTTEGAFCWLREAGEEL